MTTETINVGGRSYPRYRGVPAPHLLRYTAPATRLPAHYRPGALYARCECGWQAVIDGGHSTADLVRLERQHAGLEDP